MIKIGSVSFMDKESLMHYKRRTKRKTEQIIKSFEGGECDDSS